MNSFAQSVDTLYEGNASLQGLGFPSRGTPQPLGPLPAPANLRSYAGPDEECIRLIWNRVRGANHYQLYQATSPAGPWTLVRPQPSTRTQCLDLMSGTEYYFRVRAVGAAGPGAWSDIMRPLNRNAIASFSPGLRAATLGLRVVGGRNPVRVAFP